MGFLVYCEIPSKCLIKIGLITPKSLGVKDRPDYWCIKGWNNTLEKMDYQADVVFFGNSITYDSDFRKALPYLKIVNLGYPGDNIEGMKLRCRQISFMKPKYIFCMAGINDLLQKRTTKETITSWKDLLDSIKYTNPNAHIFIESVLPVNHTFKPNCVETDSIKLLNLLLQDLAKKRDVQFVDLFSKYAQTDGEMPEVYSIDGIHIKDSAYKIWEDQVLQIIKNNY